MASVGTGRAVSPSTVGVVTISVFPTPCRKGSCPATTTHDSGYCEQHRGERWDDDRPTAAERGYDYRWQKASKAYRRRNPICERCADKNPPVTREAAAVHHLEPLPDGARLDPENMMSVCRGCHSDLHREDG